MDLCLLKVFICTIPSHKQVLNTVGTILHSISFQIKLKNLNAIQVAFNVIQYFHLNGNYFSQNQFFFPISWRSLVVYNNINPKLGCEM